MHGARLNVHHHHHHHHRLLPPTFPLLLPPTTTCLLQARGRLSQVLRFATGEHRGVVEAILRGASVAEGRKPLTKVLRRSLFYKADQPGAVTSTTAGPLAAAALSSVLASDDVAMALHVAPSIYAGCGSEHVPYARTALRAAALLALTNPAATATAMVAMASVTLENYAEMGFGGGLATSPGGRVGAGGGGGRPPGPGPGSSTSASATHTHANANANANPDAHICLNLKSIDARCSLASLCGALLATPNDVVERHAKGPFRGLLVHLLADPSLHVASHAMLAMAGELVAVASSHAVTQGQTPGSAAKLRAEAWVSVGEIIRGADGVNVSVTSRVGRQLRPDQANAASRLAAKRKLPKSFHVEETFMVDVALLLVTNMQQLCASGSPTLRHTGLKVAKALAQARCLYVGLTTSQTWSTTTKNTTTASAHSPEPFHEKDLSGAHTTSATATATDHTVGVGVGLGGGGNGGIGGDPTESLSTAAFAVFPTSGSTTLSAESHRAATSVTSRLLAIALALATPSSLRVTSISTATVLAQTAAETMLYAAGTIPLPASLCHVPGFEVLRRHPWREGRARPEGHGHGVSSSQPVRPNVPFDGADGGDPFNMSLISVQDGDVSGGPWGHPLGPGSRDLGLDGMPGDRVGPSMEYPYYPDLPNSPSHSLMSPPGTPTPRPPPFDFEDMTGVRDPELHPNASRGLLETSATMSSAGPSVADSPSVSNATSPHSPPGRQSSLPAGTPSALLFSSLPPSFTSPTSPPSTSMISDRNSVWGDDDPPIPTSPSGPSLTTSSPFPALSPLSPPAAKDNVSPSPSPTGQFASAYGTYQHQPFPDHDSPRFPTHAHGHPHALPPPHPAHRPRDPTLRSTLDLGRSASSGPSLIPRPRSDADPLAFVSPERAIDTVLTILTDLAHRLAHTATATSVSVNVGTGGSGANDLDGNQHSSSHNYTKSNTNDHGSTVNDPTSASMHTTSNNPTDATLVSLDAAPYLFQEAVQGCLRVLAQRCAFDRDFVHPAIDTAQILVRFCPAVTAPLFLSVLDAAWEGCCPPLLAPRGGGWDGRGGDVRFPAWSAVGRVRALHAALLAARAGGPLLTSELHAQLGVELQARISTTRLEHAVYPGDPAGRLGVGYGSVAGGGSGARGAGGFAGPGYGDHGADTGLRDGDMETIGDAALGGGSGGGSTWEGREGTEGLVWPRGTVACGSSTPSGRVLAQQAAEWAAVRVGDLAHLVAACREAYGVGTPRPSSEVPGPKPDVGATTYSHAGTSRTTPTVDVVEGESGTEATTTTTLTPPQLDPAAPGRGFRGSTDPFAWATLGPNQSVVDAAGDAIRDPHPQVTTQVTVIPTHPGTRTQSSTLTRTLTTPPHR